METIGSILRAELLSASQDDEFTYGGTRLGIDEVRVLYLLPRSYAENGIDIHCYLVRLNLQAAKVLGHDKYPFMALSYLWGPRDPQQTIFINGKSMKVNPGLHQALTHIREAMAPVPLWVDAICINQSDTKERSSEVLKMGRIYAECQAVLYWLGAADDVEYVTIHGRYQTSQALVFVELGMIYDELCERGEESTFNAYELMESLYPQQKHIATKDMNQLLSSLFDNPFWKRVWITQEFILAKNGFFMWGSHTFNMKILEALLKVSDKLFPQDTGAVSGWNYRDYILALRSIRMRNKKLRLLEALVNVRYRLATLEHDYIYAMFGIANVQDIVPDYDKSKKVVALEAFQSILSQETTLDVLSCCDRGWAKNSHIGGFHALYTKTEWPDTEWPTWLPDWSYTPLKDGDATLHVNSLLFDFQEHAPVIFAAAANTQKDARILQSTGQFLVRGVEFDVVTEVLHYGIYGWQEDASRLWREPNESGLNKMYPTPSSFEKACRGISLFGRHKSFTGTLMFNKPLEGQVWENTNVSNVDLRTSEPFDEDEKSDSGGDNSESPEPLEQIRFRLETSDGTIFVTRRGYLGRAPGSMSAKVGDKVCIFLGAKVPFLLRQKEGTEHFELIREAYVHGIMKGAAIKAMQGQEKDFILV
ncbi:heterokaryon incompatibility protein-domain-containing protein [Daldinia grandis]|nr:heterokaryon incompatibility protein-domain-containing protein [Daldinia grandis]